MVFEDVPDSGQEHPANGDDGLLVSPAGFDAAIPLAELCVFLGLHEGIGDLYKKRLQVSPCTRNPR